MTREEMQRWLAATQVGHAVAARIDDDALYALSDAEALALTQIVLEVRGYVDPERSTYSGLIEQQRLFARAAR